MDERGPRFEGDKIVWSGLTRQLIDGDLWVNADELDALLRAALAARSEPGAEGLRRDIESALDWLDHGDTAAAIFVLSNAITRDAATPAADSRGGYGTHGTLDNPPPFGPAADSRGLDVERVVSRAPLILEGVMEARYQRGRLSKVTADDMAAILRVALTVALADPDRAS